MATRRNIRIVALGNPDRGDDGAALIVAARFQTEAPVVLAGRPGPGLLDLLPPDRDCLLLDVTSSGAPPGTLRQIPLDILSPASLPDARISSHGFGPGEAFALARALGRQLPHGHFIGIEGECYEVGARLSPAVEEALPRFEEMIRAVLSRFGEAGPLEEDPPPGSLPGVSGSPPFPCERP
ncbi:hydrogenase maturation protease [Gemmatimonadota bacterium]